MTKLELWFAMGGYSFYIWPAYALAAMVFLLNLLSVKLEQKRVRSKLKHWFKRQVHESCP